jgi:sRNA-binding protein
MTRSTLTLKKPQNDDAARSVSTHTLRNTEAARTLALNICERFPKLFNIELRKPLKVDIEKDILRESANDASVTTDGVYKALRYYIKGLDYIRALHVYEHRFNLNGDVCGLVTDVYNLEVSCRTDPPRPRNRMPSLMPKLFEKFPKIFNEANKKPLKKGIQKDILEILRDDPDVTVDSVSRSLNWYVRGNIYLKAIIRHEHRFDLEGNIAGDVDPAARLESKIRLQSRIREERHHTEKKQGLLES